MIIALSACKSEPATTAPVESEPQTSSSEEDIAEALTVSLKNSACDICANIVPGMVYAISGTIMFFLQHGRIAVQFCDVYQAMP